MSEPIDLFSPKYYEGVRQPLHMAETLPGCAYSSGRVYQREAERIFTKTWIYVGRVERIPNAGDYFTVTFATVPVIVTRDKSGDVRAFSNSCRHRGSQLVDGEGNCSGFKCFYHNWTYGLDGTLIGTPFVEESDCFKRGDYGLVPVRLETWAGMMFMNLDPNAGSLMDYLGDLPERTAIYDPEDRVVVRRTEYDVKCNWKIYFEGFGEGYHVPFVHKGTLSRHPVSGRDLLAAGEVRGEYTAHFTKHVGTRNVRDGKKTFPDIPAVEHMKETGTWFPAIHPMTMLSFHIDGMTSITQEFPLGPHRMLMQREVLFPKAIAARPDFDEVVQGYHRDVDIVFLEDVRAAELQHLGLASPLNVPGRFPTYAEKLVHAFDNWVLDRVLDPA